MSRMTRHGLFGASAMAVALSLGGCAVTEAPPVRTLRAAPHAGLRTLDPITTTAYITRSHGYLVYDTLFALDQNMQPQPQMVESHTLSPDRRTYTFRLAGTKICEQFGKEFRGRNFLDFAGATDRSELEQDLAVITDQGAAGVLEFEACDPSGRPVTFEALILPLTHGRQGVSRYVGAISAIDPPPWIGFEALKPHALLSHSLFWPDGRPHAVIERTNRQAPFVPELAAAKIVRFNRRHFRVLEGGRKDS